MLSSDDTNDTKKCFSEFYWLKTLYTQNIMKLLENIHVINK